MADVSIANLPAFVSPSAAATDLLPIVDVSDTSSSPLGTTKRMTVGQIGELTGPVVIGTPDPGTSAVLRVAGDVKVSGAVTAARSCQSSGLVTGVVNGGTFDITIPTRVPVRLEVTSNANPSAFRIFYIGSDGATSVVNSLMDTTGGSSYPVTAVNGTTVRVTNNTGITASFTWSLHVGNPGGI